MHPGDATPGPRDVNVLCERMGGRTRMAATQRCEFALTDKCNGSYMAASQTAAKAAQKEGGPRCNDDFVGSFVWGMHVHSLRRVSRGAATQPALHERRVSPGIPVAT